MKPLSIIPTLMMLVFLSFNSLAQLPQGFNYQGVLRDATDTEIANEAITVKFRIYAGAPGGTLTWEEEHNVTTGSFGHFSLVIGNGTRIGGSVLAFSGIQWQTGVYYLKVSIYYENSWHDFDESQIVSVPYSRVASRSLDNPFVTTADNVALLDKSISIGAADAGGSKVAIVSQDDLSEDALFDVKRSDGQTIFAVYNDGVQINIPVDPQLKGARGGFSVGGFDRAKGVVDQFMVINPDSTRFYFDDSALKGPRGGFAVGGFDRNKAIRQDYISVTPDSTRVYVQNPAKGSRGGFAVGGFDRAKGTAENFFDITPENYFIGHNSGKANVSGLYNSFVGYETGILNSSGSSNALLGFQSGFGNTTGSGNLFLGYQSGYSNSDGSYNSFMGYQAGYSNSTGGQNSFLGSYSGRSNTTGSNNTFAGFNAGFSNTEGAANNFFGTNSGYSNTVGSNNVFIGPESGYSNTYGMYNAFIGYRAGYSTDWGESNVFLGYEAGFSATNASSNIAIGYKSGHSLTIAPGNVFVGHFAGNKTTWGESNVFIGTQAGAANTTGQWNVHIGAAAGEKANASDNVFIGFGAGYETTGNTNVFIGNQTGWSNTTGANNVYLGNQTGYFNSTGSSNVFIGYQAGWSESGSNKLYIANSSTTSPLVYGDFSSGYLSVNGNLNAAGTYFRIANNPGTGASPTSYAYQGSTGSTTKSGAFSIRDALWVDGPAFYDSYLNVASSASVGTALTVGSYLNVNATGAAIRIYGDEALWYDGTYFSYGYGGTYNYFNKRVTIGHSVGSSSYMLYIQGNAYTTGIWAGSDGRFKKEVLSIDDPVGKVMQMNGVSYLWKTDEYEDKNFPDGRHYGVIAQEVERVLPEIVNESEQGEKSVAYNEIIPVLIEAIKEQQKTIESQKAENEKMSLELQELREEMNLIKAALGLAINE